MDKESPIKIDKKEDRNSLLKFLVKPMKNHQKGVSHLWVLQLRKDIGKGMFKPMESFQ